MVKICFALFFSPPQDTCRSFADCSSIRATSAAYFAAAAVDVVGKFGNASQINSEDWVPLLVDDPGASGTISDGVLACSNVLVSSRLTFLVARYV